MRQAFIFYIVRFPCNGASGGPIFRKGQNKVCVCVCARVCVCVCACARASARVYVWKIPLLRGFSSVLWQVLVIRTGMIFIAHVACLLDSVCLAGKDKKTYGHTYCTWPCVSVCVSACVCVLCARSAVQSEVVSQLGAWEKWTWQLQTVPSW